MNMLGATGDVISKAIADLEPKISALVPDKAVADQVLAEFRASLAGLQALESDADKLVVFIREVLPTAIEKAERVADKANELLDAYKRGVMVLPIAPPAGAVPPPQAT